MCQAPPPPLCALNCQGIPFPPVGGPGMILPPVSSAVSAGLDVDGYAFLQHLNLAILVVIHKLMWGKSHSFYKRPFHPVLLGSR